MKKILEENLIVEERQTSFVYYDEINGDIIVQSGANFIAPDLKSCGGDIYIHDKASFDAPKLKTCGGDIYIHKRAKITLPMMVSCGGGHFIIHRDVILKIP